MNRREFLATAATIGPASVLVAKFSRAASHIKWAVFSQDTDVHFQTVMKPYAETVQRETNGDVAFDLFPNGALGRNPSQQPQLVVDGVADMAWVIQSYSPGRFPDTEVLELPGLFGSLRNLSLVASRLAARNVFRDYGDFYVVGLWCVSPYSIHTNFPIKSIADLKGKTIRASSRNDSAALRALGAVPVGMPLPEVAEAISRGTISGTTADISPFFAFGLDRVTNNHFFVGLGTLPVAILMSRKVFDRLPEADQSVIQKNGGPALTEMWISAVTEFNRIHLKRLKDDPKHHVIVPSPVEMEQIQALLAPIRDEWVAASDRHKQLKAEVDAELAKVRTEDKG